MNRKWTWKNQNWQKTAHWDNQLTQIICSSESIRESPLSLSPHFSVLNKHDWIWMEAELITLAINPKCTVHLLTIWASFAFFSICCKLKHHMSKHGHLYYIFSVQCIGCVLCSYTHALMDLHINSKSHRSCWCGLYCYHANVGQVKTTLANQSYKSNIPIDFFLLFSLILFICFNSLIDWTFLFLFPCTYCITSTQHFVILSVKGAIEIKLACLLTYFLQYMGCLCHK